MGKQKAASDFIYGLIDMLGLGNKATREAVRPVLQRASQAAKQQLGPPLPTRAPQTGNIGGRVIVTPTRQAPVPEFGNRGVLPGISEMARIRTGADPVTAEATAAAIEKTAPDLANIIRQNAGQASFPSSPSASAYNYYQPGLPLRFPAGATNLVPTTSTAGRITPAGTRVGGRPYTPESMASPRNVETARIAGTERLADLPDAPARIPGGQMSIDFSPNRQIGEEAAASMDSTAPELASIFRQNAGIDPMRPMGVQVTDLQSLIQNMTPAQRASMGLVGAGSTVAGLGQIISDRANQEQAMRNFGQFTEADAAAYEANRQQAMRNIGQFTEADAAAYEANRQQAVNPTLVGSQKFSAPVVPPSVPPLAPPPATSTGAPLTRDQSQALSQYISSTQESMQQTDPVSAGVARMVAPRDPSSYGNIGDYYADRERFVSAMSNGSLRDLINRVGQTAQDQAQEIALQSWATANKPLAYELINRMQMANPAANQQSGEQVTTSTYGSAMGDNNQANAMGQANASAAQIDSFMAPNELEVANRRQRNNEILSATQPFERPVLTPTRNFMQDVNFRQQLGGF